MFDVQKGVTFVKILSTLTYFYFYSEHDKFYLQQTFLKYIYKTG